jgi:hypothetical protein
MSRQPSELYLPREGVCLRPADDGMYLDTCVGLRIFLNREAMECVATTILRHSFVIGCAVEQPSK